MLALKIANILVGGVIFVTTPTGSIEGEFDLEVVASLQSAFEFGPEFVSLGLSFLKNIAHSHTDLRLVVPSKCFQYCWERDLVLNGGSYLCGVVVLQLYFCWFAVVK